jgi:hypothetical protein
VYELTYDVGILDRMIEFVDAALECGNDILPVSQGGQRVM